MAREALKRDFNMGDRLRSPFGNSESRRPKPKSKLGSRDKARHSTTHAGVYRGMPEPARGSQLQEGGSGKYNAYPTKASVDKPEPCFSKVKALDSASVKIPPGPSRKPTQNHRAHLGRVCFHNDRGDLNYLGEGRGVTR